MGKALLLGGGLVLLLLAALTACSDGLSAGDDDPLADKDIYKVSGTVYLVNPLEFPVPHEADVGLRHMCTSPFTTYIDTKTSDEETGYYEFLLGNLESGWYACDAWYEEDTDRWEGSSTQFEWDNEDPHNFIRDIYMYLVE